jgi:hypothetical protein
MKTIVLYTITAFLLVTCSKEKPPVSTISGIVVNYGSLQPIDSVEVSVISGNGGGQFGATAGSGEEVKTYTDKNGQFSITITGEALLLYLYKKKYRYDDEIFGAYKSYTAGINYQNEVLKLQAYARFDGYFQCKTCLESDTSYIADFILIHNGQILDHGTELHLGNKVIEHGFQFPIIPGDTYKKYGIHNQINGVWQPLIIDSVYIKSFTTYTDTIYY